MTRFKYPNTFTFCAPSTTKSVYVYGSWDGYACGYALTVSNNTAAWKGTIKVPITTTVEPDGSFVQTYWYHYDVDGNEEHDKSEPCVEEPKTGRFLNFFTISDNIWSSQSLEAYPTKGRPLSLSKIKSPIPKPTGSRILESEARTIESRINAPYLPKSTKPTAFTSPVKDHTQSSQDSLVSTLEKLGLDTAIPSSGCPTDSRCICERYGITRGGGRIKLDCGGTRCGGYWSCSDSEEEDTGA